MHHRHACHVARRRQQPLTVEQAFAPKSGGRGVQRPLGQGLLDPRPEGEDAPRQSPPRMQFDRDADDDRHADEVRGGDRPPSTSPQFLDHAVRQIGPQQARHGSGHVRLDDLDGVAAARRLDRRDGRHDPDSVRQADRHGVRRTLQQMSERDRGIRIWA